MTDTELLQSLYDKHQEGRFESIFYLRKHRTEIEEATGLRVPRRPADIESWYRSKKSVLARRLNPDNLEEVESDGGDEETEENSETNEEKDN